jgi:hypothetical protein
LTPVFSVVDWAHADVASSVAAAAKANFLTVRPPVEWA